MSQSEYEFLEPFNNTLPSDYCLANNCTASTTFTNDTFAPYIEGFSTTVGYIAENGINETNYEDFENYRLMSITQTYIKADHPVYTRFFQGNMT